MELSKERIDQVDVIYAISRDLTEEDNAETSRRIKETFALQDSLSAQGYSEAEVLARLKARFAVSPQTAVVSRGYCHYA